MNEPRIDVAQKIRAALIECSLQRKDGSYYATPEAAQRLTAILERQGIRAMVSVDKDERLEVRPLL